MNDRFQDDHTQNAHTPMDDATRVGSPHVGGSPAHPGQANPRQPAGRAGTSSQKGMRTDLEDSTRLGAYQSRSLAASKPLIQDKTNLSPLVTVGNEIRHRPPPRANRGWPGKDLQ